MAQCCVCCMCVLAEHVPSLGAMTESVSPYLNQLIGPTAKVTITATNRAVQAVWPVVWSIVHYFGTNKDSDWAGAAAAAAATTTGANDTGDQLLKVTTLLMQLLTVAHRYLSMSGTVDTGAPSPELTNAMGTLHGVLVVACACVGDLSPKTFGFMHRILIEQVVDFFDALESNECKADNAVMDDLVLVEILLSLEHTVNYDVAKSLQAFYMTHKPELADYSDMELLRYNGSEAALWAKLKRTFGQTPDCPPTLPKDKACSTWGTRKGSPKVGDTVQVTGLSSKASLMAACPEAASCVVQVASRYGRQSGNLRVVSIHSIAKPKRQHGFSKKNPATRLLAQLRGGRGSSSSSSNSHADPNECLSRFKKFNVLEEQLRVFVSAPGSSYPLSPSFHSPFGGPRGYPTMRPGDSDSSSSDIPPYIPYEVRQSLGYPTPSPGGDSPTFDPSAGLFDFPGRGPPGGAPPVFSGVQVRKDSPSSGLLAQPPSPHSRPSISSMFGGPPPRGIPSYSPSSRPRRPDYARYMPRMSADSGSESQPSIDDLVDSLPSREHSSGMPEDVMALRELLESRRRGSRGRRPFDGSRLSEHARRLVRARQSMSRSDAMDNSFRELNSRIEQVLQRVRSAPGDDAVIQRIRPILQQFVLLRGSINEFRSSDGEPLLPAAVRHGTTVKVLRFLVEDVQCDLEATGSGGADTTALCVAFEVGNDEAVKMFLELGANAQPALSLLKSSKRSGHWEFQGDGQKWQRYETSTGAKIEKAYQRFLTNRGKPENVEISCGRNKYRVWFKEPTANSNYPRMLRRGSSKGKTAVKSNTFSQENVNTHYRRPVRRQFFDQKTVAAILAAAKKAKAPKSTVNGAASALATVTRAPKNPQMPDTHKSKSSAGSGGAESGKSWPDSPFGITMTTKRSAKDSEFTRRRRSQSDRIKDPLGLEKIKRKAHPMAVVVWNEVLPAVMALSRRPNNQRKVQLRIVQHLAFLIDMGMFRGDPLFYTEEEGTTAEATGDTKDQNTATSEAQKSPSPTDATGEHTMDVEEPVKVMDVETSEEGDELTMVMYGVAWALQPLFDDDDVAAAVLAAHVMRGLLRFSAKAISCAQGASGNSKKLRSAQAAALVLLSFEKQHGLLSLLRLRGLDAKPRQSLLEALKLVRKSGSKLSSEAKTAITAVERSRTVLQTTFQALHQLLISAGGPRVITTPNTAGLKQISQALTQTVATADGSAAAAKQKLNDLAIMLDVSCNLESGGVEVTGTDASDDTSDDAAANSAEALVDFAIGRTPLTTCEVVDNDLPGVLLAYLRAPRVSASVSQKTNSPDRKFRVRPQNTRQDMEQRLQVFLRILWNEFRT